MNEEKNVSDFDVDFNQLLEMFTGQWDYLAPMAYGSYLKNGRGAFLIDLSMVEVDNKSRTMSPPTFYVPENNLQWLANVIDDRTKNLLKTYDVEKMVILLLKFRDNSIKTMFIGTENNRLSPKELYEEQEKGTVH